MYNMMKKLVEKKFYATAEAAQGKLDAFFEVGRLTDEQYADLSALVVSVYTAPEVTGA